MSERAYAYDRTLSTLVRLAKLPENAKHLTEIRAALEQDHRSAVAIGKSREIHALKDALADIPTEESQQSPV